MNLVMRIAADKQNVCIFNMSFSEFQTLSFFISITYHIYVYSVASFYHREVCGKILKHSSLSTSFELSSNSGAAFFPLIPEFNLHQLYKQQERDLLYKVLTQYQNFLIPPRMPPGQCTRAWY